MDTVSEGRLAIALAREGGIGIIHRNLAPEAEAREVEIVKRSESGMISDPVTLPPTASLQEAENIMGRFHISGVPIVDPANRKLVGILTNRDIRFTEPEDYTRPVSDFMTSTNLVTAPLTTTLEQARLILQKHRIEKLPLVDADGHIEGLITVKDIQKKTQFPYASVDKQGRLVVGAAVGVGADLEARAEAVAAKGADVLVVDTAHGHSLGVINAIKRIKQILPQMPVIAGNVVTEEGTLALIEAGADAIKIGIGAGSICTTRVISGAGMPQMTAIYHCARAVWAAWVLYRATGATATPPARRTKAASWCRKAWKGWCLLKAHCTILFFNWWAGCAPGWVMQARRRWKTCAIALA